MNKGIDFVGVAVVYFCHDGEGNIVMGQRSEQSRDEKGRWDIGGGSVEVEDSIEQTLRKEIKEEYGTDVLNFEYLGYRDVLREHEGQKTHWIALDFKALVNKEQVKNGEPHKFNHVGWFTLNNMPSPVHSQLPTFLEKYKDRL